MLWGYGNQATAVGRREVRHRRASRPDRTSGPPVRASRTILLGLALLAALSARAEVAYEVTSPYHHIRVLDQDGMRTLCFDDATETRMSLTDPLSGHFEYTEYFHMPWLWNTNISRVLMIGLGGGSVQRSFEYYYPNTRIDTVEIDPSVVQIARDYFRVKESERQQVHVSDGRQFLRRSTGKYDLILLDAYVQGRYGAGIPQHLATREFFTSVRDHLTTNGIVADNVIGSLDNWHAEIVGAIYRTLKTVFPQVYIFPARSSLNVVLVATRAAGLADLNGLRQRALLMVDSGQIKLPGFRQRLEVLQPKPPRSVTGSPLLTDDYAPVEGLVGGGGPGARPPGAEQK
jgi:spermidine synthase